MKGRKEEKKRVESTFNNFEVYLFCFNIVETQRTKKLVLVSEIFSSERIS